MKDFATFFHEKLAHAHTRMAKFATLRRESVGQASHSGIDQHSLHIGNCRAGDVALTRSSASLSTAAPLAAGGSTLTPANADDPDTGSAAVTGGGWNSQQRPSGHGTVTVQPHSQTVTVTGRSRHTINTAHVSHSPTMTAQVTTVTQLQQSCGEKQSARHIMSDKSTALAEIRSDRKRQVIWVT